MIANDFGSLQSARSRRNEFEVQGYFRALDEARAQAQQQESFNQNDVNNQLNARQLRQRMAEQAYFRSVGADARDFRNREFDWRRSNASADRDWHLKNTAVAEAKLAAQERARAEAADIDRFNYEQGLAEQGLGGSSNRLADEENAMLWETRSGARKDLEQKNQYFRSIADAMNLNPTAYDNMIAAEKDNSWNPKNNGLFNDTPDDTAIAEWTAAAELGRKRQSNARSAMADRNFPKESILEVDGRYRAQPLPWEQPFFSTAPTSAVAAPVAAPISRKSLDRNAAMIFLKQAGGDKALARRLATEAGYAL